MICLELCVEPSLVCVPRGAEADRALRGKAGRHCGGAILRRADPARRPAKDVQRGALPCQVCSLFLCSFSAQFRCPNHPSRGSRGLGMARGRCWLQHAHLQHSSSPRWWVGEWQKCSATCGTSGLMKRTVLCIQSVGLDEQRALQQADCQHLSKPESTVPCHRDVPCPSQWAVGNWSEVRPGAGVVAVPCKGGQSTDEVPPGCPQPGAGKSSPGTEVHLGLALQHQITQKGISWHREVLVRNKQQCFSHFLFSFSEFCCFLNQARPCSVLDAEGAETGRVKAFNVFSSPTSLSPLFWQKPYNYFLLAEARCCGPARV